MVVIASDTFVRANQSGWGTSSGGQVWSKAQGPGVPSISSNKGIISETSTSGNTTMLLGTVTKADGQISGTYTSTNINNDSLAVVLRDNGTGQNDYQCGIAFLTSNTFYLAKNVSGSFTVLASTSFTVANNTSYSTILKIVGSSLSAWIWLASNAQPGVPTLTSTDTTYTSGRFGVNAYGSIATDVDTFTSVSMDDLTVAAGGTYYDRRRRLHHSTGRIH